MAIPQPQFVGPTKAQYQQQANRDLGASMGRLANTGLQKQRLNEEQRQYDFNNLLKVADNIRLTQHHGNWVSFAEGNPGMAKSIFTGIYGDKEGGYIFQQFADGTPETRQQIVDRVLDEGMLEGWGDEEQSEGQRSGDGGRQREEVEPTPVDYSRTEPEPAPQQRTNREGFQANVPEQEAGAMRSGGITGGVSGGGDSRTVDYLSQADKAASEGMYLENGLRKSAGVEDAPVPINTETIDTIFSDVEIPQGASAKKIAQSISGAVSKYDEEAARFFAQGTAYLREGTDEQWAEFDKKAQKYFGVDGDTLFAVRNQMFDNVEEGRPVNYMPPENARDSWWWTGQNIPPYAKVRDFVQSDEQTEGPGAVEDGGSTSTSASASTSASTKKSAEQVEKLSKVSKDISKVDMSTLSPAKMETMQEGISKLGRQLLEQTIMRPGSLESLSKSLNLPKETTTKVADWTESLNEASDKEFQRYQDLKRREPRTARAVKRMFDKVNDNLTNAVQQAKRVRAERRANRESTRAEEIVAEATGREPAEEDATKRKKKKKEPSRTTVMAATLALSEERRKEIFRDAVSDNPSNLMKASLPQEVVDRRTTERELNIRQQNADTNAFNAQTSRDRLGIAESQFNRSAAQSDARIALERRRVALDEKRFGLQEGQQLTDEEAKRLRAAEIAYAETRNELMAEELEAMRNGEAPIDLTGPLAALEVDEATIKRYEDAMMERAEGDPETYKKLRTKALNSDPIYRSAVDSVAQIKGLISGVSPQKIKDTVTYGRFETTGPFGKLFSPSKDYSAEYYVTGPNVYSGDTPEQDGGNDTPTGPDPVDKAVNDAMNEFTPTY